MVLYYCIKCKTLVEHTTIECPTCQGIIFKKVRDPSTKKVIEAK